MNATQFCALALSMALLLASCALPLQQEPVDLSQRRLESRPLPTPMADVAAQDEAEENLSVMPLGTATTAEAAVAPQIQTSAEDDSSSPFGALTLLDLASADATFLETIQRVKSSLDNVTDHRYVELVDGRGTTWQGEGLVSADRSLLLLQPLQSGGQQAVQIELDPEMTLDDLDENENLAALLAETDIARAEPDLYDAPNAEILFVRAQETNPGIWRFDVRVNHPDVGWEDYTDGWHVETSDGQILATRILLHPHENEMPFSRSQGGVEIPAAVNEVQIRSHDLVSGYARETVVVPIAEKGSGEKYEVDK